MWYFEKPCTQGEVSSSMVTPTSHSRLSAALLGLCTAASGAWPLAEEASGQDRIFSSFFNLRTKFTPQEAPTDSTGARLRFERTLEPTNDTPGTLRNAFDDAAALRISWGRLSSRALPSGCELMLHDGSSLMVDGEALPESVLSKGASITIEKAGARFDIPVLAVRAVRTNPDVRYDLAWSKILAETDSPDDVVAVRRPHGILDELHGVVRSISSEYVECALDGETYRVPHAKIEGIVLVRPLSAKTAQATTRMATLETDQCILRCAEVAVGDEGAGSVSVTTPSGVRAVLPLDKPFRFDRAQQRAITPQDMKFSFKRLPEFSERVLSLPRAERPLAFPRAAFSISGEGLDSSLTIHGATELEIQVPAGRHTLYFQPEFLRNSPMSFSFSYQETGSPRSPLYSQDRFPSPEGLVAVRNECALVGPGTLSVRAGNCDESMRFSLFMLVPSH
jgi:hypothetical protein